MRVRRASASPTGGEGSHIEEEDPPPPCMQLGGGILIAPHTHSRKLRPENTAAAMATPKEARAC